jgi:DMSO/TMAO reductase YedYZ molybdopterin-dependent catalytic subunit
VIAVKCALVGASPVLTLVLLTGIGAPALAQHRSSAEPGTLAISGAVERPLNLQISDLEKMPHVRVEVKNHDGSLVAFDGVLLADLLKSAGAPIGERLRGANMASYVLAEAQDGYRVIFALPELDPAFTDSKGEVRSVSRST